MTHDLKQSRFYGSIKPRIHLTDPAYAKACHAQFFSSIERDPNHQILKPALDQLFNCPEIAFFFEGIFSHSPYLFKASRMHPDLLVSLIDSSPREILKHTLIKMSEEIRTLTHEETIMQCLRRYKVKLHLLIALADLSQIWSLEKVVSAMTQLAETVIHLSLQASLFFILQKERTPPLYFKDECIDKINPDLFQRFFKQSGFFVLALGKLGSKELNYSSDIDIVFFYDKKKWLRLNWNTPERSIIKLTQKAIHLLNTQTADGYVFRVDIRLRPDSGNKSPIHTTESAEHYYETLGQNWERAMLIKARIIAGDIQSGKTFINKLIPYIWRRSLDYNAISDIHAIMRQIYKLSAKDQIKISGHNIKLGRGGIREIEFFTQVQQLILGGRYTVLRQAKTEKALKALYRLGFLSKSKYIKLTHYYSYLRFIEHRLQMVHDHQTHTMPDQNRKAFAGFCGYKSYAALKKRLIRCLKSVHAIYISLVEKEDSLASSKGSLVFTGTRLDYETLNTLKQLNFERPEEAWHMMSSWLGGRIHATQTEKARTLLTRLAPKLIEAASKTGQPDIAFARFADFFSGLPVGNSVLSLFLNNPRLMNKIIDILGLAPRLAPLLAKKPALMDSMIDPNFSHSLSNKTCFDKYSSLLTPDMCFEEALNTLRIVFNESQFKIGAHLLSNRLNPLKAGQIYAREAEAILYAIYRLARAEVDRLYGHIDGEWAIIGLGSLGAEELTSRSDLDLMIVYQTNTFSSQNNSPSSNSNSSQTLSSQEYFSRITKRLITALSAPTEHGTIYTVDMQLRPSGITSPNSVQFPRFKRYYLTKLAWTWELMALTHARIIVSEKLFGTKIKRVINKSLKRKRDPIKIAKYVVDIREKLAKQHENTTHWEFKYCRGGLIDIHFIVEYLQLIHAHSSPFILTPKTRIALRRLYKAHYLTETEFQNLKTGFDIMLGLQQVFQLTHHDSYEKLISSNRVQKLLFQFLDLKDPALLEKTLKEIQRKIYLIYQKKIEKTTEIQKSHV